MLLVINRWSGHILIVCIKVILLHLMFWEQLVIWCFNNDNYSNMISMHILEHIIMLISSMQVLKGLEWRLLFFCELWPPILVEGCAFRYKLLWAFSKWKLLCSPIASQITSFMEIDIVQLFKHMVLRAWPYNILW